MNRCPPSDRLGQLLGERLSGAEREEIAAHLEACADCQREMELYGSYTGAGSEGSWDKVSEADAPLEEQRDIDISEIEMDLSSNR